MNMKKKKKKGITAPPMYKFSSGPPDIALLTCMKFGY